jgi:hypothetical protein
MDDQLVFTAGRLSLTEILSQNKSVESFFTKCIFKHFIGFYDHVFKFHIELNAATLFFKSPPFQSTTTCTMLCSQLIQRKNFLLAGVKLETVVSNVYSLLSALKSAICFVISP